jgi:hypothetical protein
LIYGNWKYLLLFRCNTVCSHKYTTIVDDTFGRESNLWSNGTSYGC